MLALVIVSKYSEHLPLYRQAQVFARHRVMIERSTLADWVGRAAFRLAPIVDRMAELIKRSSKLFMDEATAPVLDPGRGKTKTGYLWALATRPCNALPRSTRSKRKSAAPRPRWPRHPAGTFQTAGRRAQRFCRRPARAGVAQVQHGPMQDGETQNLDTEL
jgi:hypothetical protein